MLNQKLVSDNNTASSKYELYPQKELTNEVIEQILGNGYKISSGIIKKDGKIISDKYNILSYIKIENNYILIGKQGSMSNILNLDKYGYIQKVSEDFHELYYNKDIKEWIIGRGSGNKIIDIYSGECLHKGTFQFIRNEGGKIIGYNGSQKQVIHLCPLSLFDDRNIDKHTIKEELDKIDILYERFGTKNEHNIVKLIIKDLRDNFEKNEKMQMINLLFILLTDELLKKEINNLIGSKFDINSEEGRKEIVNILSKTNYNIITSEELSKIKDNYEVFAFVKKYILNKNSVGNIISKTKYSIGTVIGKNFINLSVENIKSILSMNQLQNLKIEDKMSLLVSLENLIKRMDLKKLINNQNEFGFNTDDRKYSERRDLITKNRIVTYVLKNMQIAYEKDEDIIIPELVSDIENQIESEIRKRGIEEISKRSNSESSTDGGGSGKSRSNGGRGTKSSSRSSDNDIGIATTIATGSITAGFIADAIFGDD